MNFHKKQIFIFIIGSLFLISLFSVQGANAAAGTAATFGNKTVDQSIENAWVTFHFTGLTASAEFILVQATIGNTTFSSGSGQTTKAVTVLVDSSGSLTFDVYGYDVATGENSSTVLDSWLLTVTPSSDFNSDQLTDAIPFFIGLMVAGIILGVAVKKAY